MTELRRAFRPCCLQSVTAGNGLNEVLRTGNLLCTEMMANVDVDVKDRQAGLESLQGSAGFACCSWDDLAQHTAQHDHTRCKGRDGRMTEDELLASIISCCRLAAEIALPYGG